jgi:hypothetical protein
VLGAHRESPKFFSLTSGQLLPGADDFRLNLGGGSFHRWAWFKVA